MLLTRSEACPGFFSSEADSPFFRGEKQKSEAKFCMSYRAEYTRGEAKYLIITKEILVLTSIPMPPTRAFFFIRGRLFSYALILCAFLR